MFENKKQGAVDVIAGEGPVNAETLDALQNVASQCLTEGQPRLVFDLSQVALFDSVGLEYLLDLSDQCINHGGMLRLSAPNSLCNDILDVCGVSTKIEVCSDTTTAVARFSQ